MSDKIKLNIQNGHSMSDSDKREMQAQQYQPKQEDRNNNIEPETSGRKTGLFIFIVLLLIIATNVAMFLFMNNKSKRPSMKFIPESAIMSSTMSPKSIESILTSNKTSFIFPNAISTMKEQLAELSVDYSDILACIKHDIFIVFIKGENTTKAENIIIAQLPEESLFRQEIEDKIKRNFNVNYSTYRGENLVNVSSLSFGEANVNFSYAVVGDVLIMSNSESNVRIAVDAGR
ncbi:hypothetical protein D4R87_02620 [bacterium]|nr:MAG: hypothetical protein D4R87_02620 [bacterium]